MFPLGVFGILALIVVVVLLEVALFWAASSLGDAPPASWGKRALVSLLATLACALVGAGVGWSLRSAALLSLDNPLLIAVVGLLAVLVSWVVPGVLYAPLAPVSVPRGMLIAGVQVLLRIFLYVLIAAVLLVGLALLQIARGTDARTELTAPVLACLGGLLP